MASSIDSTKPVTGSPTTQSVRDNFSFTKTEINELQRITEDAVTAAGTVDALTADFTNDVTLAEGVTIVVLATGANTSTTPTLNVDGTGARTIVKDSGAALVAGDIAGSRHYLLLRYDATNTVWVLMNPATRQDSDIDHTGLQNIGTNSHSAIDAHIADNSEHQAGLTGAVMAFAMSSAPSGWLECDGSAVSRTTYAGLFTAIGTTYGSGDGSTTFNVPDLRGEFIRGWDNGAGNDPDAASRTDSGDGTTGDNVGTKQDDEIKVHTHAGGSATLAGGSGPASRLDGGVQTTNPTGGNETRPRNIAMMYCIRT